MTDIVSRLRELANHRAKILGKRPEDMEEWQAAEKIASLEGKLRLSEAALNNLENDYNFIRSEMERVLQETKK